ncbi:MAG: VWA domain-containing protein [Acidobacteriota bacterium]
MIFKSCCRRLGATGMLLLLSVAAPAQQKDEPIKLESTLVLVDAIVLSRKTNTAVGDLKRDDFKIEEDGKRQAITHFSREGLPLSVVLLLDISGSMYPVIDELQRTALDALSRLKPQDKVALMVFANRPRLVSDLTTDHKIIAEKLDDLLDEASSIGSWTFINSGLLGAARYLRANTTATERRAIVLITDDVDTSSAGWESARKTVERELFETGATLCAITFGPGGGVKSKVIRAGATAAITVAAPGLGAILIASRLLGRLKPTRGSAKYYAERTGGVAVEAKRDEAALHFAGVLELLRTRYTFGYAPADTTPDGRFREISVTLSDRAKKEKGDVRVLARRGYYIRKEFDPRTYRIKNN